MKGDAFELYQKPLSEIPIKQIQEAQQYPFIKYSDMIMDIKQENCETDTTHLERQIDELVFKLYDLTYEEVLVVDKDFWLSEAKYAAVVV